MTLWEILGIIAFILACTGLIGLSAYLAYRRDLHLHQRQEQKRIDREKGTDYK
jgi:hypothetical protein